MRALLFCVAATIVSLSSTGEPETAPECKNIDFVRLPKQGTFGRNHSTIRHTNEKFIEGKVRAVGLVVISNQVTHYPPLAEGDLLPIVGFIYRLEKANDILIAKWVAAADLPKGISPLPDSYIIPTKNFNQGGWSEIRRETYLYVQDVAKDENGVYAVLYTTGRAVESKVRVSVGETIVYDSYSRKVRNIVPSDEKSQVIGWIELGPEVSILPK